MPSTETTALSICNLGLGKIGASRCTTLSPPRSPVERHCAVGYPQWRDDELENRRWYFALEKAQLALVDEIEGEDLKYKFALPNDCLRVIRTPKARWQQRGLFLYDIYPDVKIEYIRRATEDEFPASFIEVLACRVALESAEFVTQSNTKKADTHTLYDDAVNRARRNASFVTEPESTEGADEHFDWVTSRF